MRAILPASASPMMRTLERTALRARQLVFEKSIIGNDLSRIFNLDEYLTHPELENFLPFVAWMLQIPVWRDEWTVGQKVEFIRAWLRCKSNAGTEKAISDAISALGFSASIERTGSYQIRVRISESIDPDDRAAILRVVDELKPLRSGSKLQLVFTSDANLYQFVTLSMVKILRISDMATILQTLTEIGQLAIFGSGGEDGVRYEFSRIELGTDRYVPDPKQRGLKGTKLADIEVADTKNFARFAAPGSRERVFGTNVTAKVSAAGDYEVGEMALYVKANGREELFAVASRPDGILSRKIQGEELLISIDVFTTAKLQEIAIVGTGERLNLSVTDQISDISEQNLELRSILQIQAQRLDRQSRLIEALEARIRDLEVGR